MLVCQIHFSRGQGRYLPGSVESTADRPASQLIAVLTRAHSRVLQVGCEHSSV